MKIKYHEAPVYVVLSTKAILLFRVENTPPLQKNGDPYVTLDSLAHLLQNLEGEVVNDKKYKSLS